MRHLLNETTLEVIKGDLTGQHVDAIVNAANSALCGGGGVDGAIHKAGGPEILAECRRIVGGCPTGRAVCTTGGKLPAKRVIHTVGPVWSGGSSGEPELLASAYRSSLELAAQHKLRSLAFPSISTGAYRFPLTKAAEIAWTTIVAYCRERPDEFDLLRMVAFSESDAKVYAAALSQAAGEPA